MLETICDTLVEAYRRNTILLLENIYIVPVVPNMDGTFSLNVIIK
jgi:hypothetical protein